ncbi:MAG: hypothetical protein L3J11_00630, partial [Draconibacterium sp.]|nr:hypothetical protein [Draconibacterium sp.]
SSKDWETTYYGIGPEYNVSFNKFSAKFIVRAGILSIKPVDLKISYAENVDITIPVYSLNAEKTSKISYFSTAIKIGYNFTRNLSLFLTADYLSALSNK